MIRATKLRSTNNTKKLILIKELLESTSEFRGLWLIQFLLSDKPSEIQELKRDVFLVLVPFAADWPCCVSSEKSLKQGARCWMGR